MIRSIAAAVVVLAGTVGAAGAQETMSFFVTSANPGKGGDLGGPAGADAYCTTLAEAAGVGGRVWAAYLSTSAENARDRIGAGPWYNAKGEKIADDVSSLHSDANNLTKATALDEAGNVVNGRGDSPNRHDILTGSQPDGRAFPVERDTTCSNWTSSSAEGSAVVGHHDRVGPTAEAWATSWNFSHQSAGCSQEALVRTGGSGRLYCFAAK